jgi:hypothetical protein
MAGGADQHQEAFFFRRAKAFQAVGSVATLPVARDTLAGCSSRPLRFAFYSSGGNLSRRSSCWQWGGTCAFPFRTATSRSCSPSGPARRSRHRLDVVQRYGPEMTELKADGVLDEW